MNDKGKNLIIIARNAIGEAFGFEPKAYEEGPWLLEPAATFVTLTMSDVLRGCIGSLEARRPLLDDLKNNAKASAFNDPRFPPLAQDEFNLIRVEVSLLSAPEAIESSDEATATEQLRPFVDGIIFEYGKYRSTFLPQVWEQLPDPKEFLIHLKTKAGLSSGFWAEGVKLQRYTVIKWKET
ncbi:MAG: AmmeMemoRadiSam system protein A [Deltaproteobacteria bacterium]|nr:AmmeMemoRadiSam system protein A [Deltaproteobacteria bacterium]